MHQYVCSLLLSVLVLFWCLKRQKEKESQSSLINVSVCFCSVCCAPHVALICFLLPPTPLLPFTETCGHQVVQNKSFLSRSHIMFSSLFFDTIQALYITKHKNLLLFCKVEGKWWSWDHPGQDMSVCVCPGNVLMDQPVNRTYISNISWVYCSGVRSATFMLFTCFSGIKWKPQLCPTIMCIPSLWPGNHSFVESINSSTWTCSHKYTVLCPDLMERDLTLDFLTHSRHSRFFCLSSVLSLSSSVHLFLTLTKVQQSCCLFRLDPELDY